MRRVFAAGRGWTRRGWAGHGWAGHGWGCGAGHAAGRRRRSRVHPGCGSSASTVPAGRPPVRPPVRPPARPPGPPVGWNALDHESLAGFRSGRRRAEPAGLAGPGPPSGGAAASPLLGGGSNAPRLGTSPAGRRRRTGSAGRTPGGGVRPPGALPGTRRGSWPGARGSRGAAGGRSPGTARPASSPSHVGGPSSPSKRARSRRPLSAGRAGRS